MEVAPVDAATDALIRERIAEEGARRSFPEGFPLLPDLPFACALRRC